MDQIKLKEIEVATAQKELNQMKTRKRLAQKIVDPFIEEVKRIRKKRKKKNRVQKTSRKQNRGK